MGDIRMVEIGQDLTFRAEAADHVERIPTGPNQFDRNALLELPIDALGAPHRAHPATTDFLNQTEGPDCASAEALIRNFAFPIGQAGHHSGCLCFDAGAHDVLPICMQQRKNLLAHLQVIDTPRVQLRRPGRSR